MAKKKGVGYRPTGTVYWQTMSGQKIPKTMDPKIHPWDPPDARAKDGGSRGAVEWTVFAARYGVPEEDAGLYLGVNPQGFYNENFFRNNAALEGMFKDGNPEVGSPDEWDGCPTFEEATDFAYKHDRGSQLYANYPMPSGECE